MSAAIQRFTDRVKQMQTGRSKEMRLTYEEAFALVLALSELSTKLIAAEERLSQSSEGTVISGGTLKPTQTK